MDRIEEALEYVFREGFEKGRRSGHNREQFEGDPPLKGVNEFTPHLIFPVEWDRIQYEARRMLGDD